MQADTQTGAGGQEASTERRLVAVLHADVVGYSRLIGIDDKGTVLHLRLLRRELIDPELHRHDGRIVNTAGDSMLLMFPSITAAVRCALDFQRCVPEYDGDMPSSRQIRFRIGINIAGIISDEADIHGDGVNIAARLQSICPPGGVCISRAVYDHIRGRLSLPFQPLGQLQLKNIAQPVEAFALNLEAVAGSRGYTRGRRPTRLFLPAGIAALICILASALGWRELHQPGTAQIAAATAGPLSLAVLPLENLSRDPDQEYLADGIAEDLTTDLSHLAGAEVIARESAFTYKGRAVDVRDVGRQLGVRYVLEGSVRKLGSAVRVNAQLVETDTGAPVWAERFDEPMRDLAVGQDEIVARIGSALNVQLVNLATSSHSRTAGNPEAFDLVLRARSVLAQPPTWVRFTIPAGLYEQALLLDPNAVPAMTGVASMLLRGYQGAEFVKRAADLISAAEKMVPGSPDVLAAKFLLQRRQAQWAESMETFHALLDIDSSAAGIVGQTRICAGCWGPPDAAIPLLMRAIRLNPRSPSSGVLAVDLAHLLPRTGKDAEAIPWLEQALQQLPDGFTGNADADLQSGDPRASAYLLLGSAYALTGRLDDAKRMVALAMQSPRAINITIRSWLRSVTRFSDPATLQGEQHIAEGFRLAGLRDHLDEDADSGVPPENTLRLVTRFDEPTPMTIAGASTIKTADMQRLLEQNKPLILTTADARYNPTIQGAIRIEVPGGGELTDEWQSTLRRMINGLIGDDPRRPIVVFGYSINSWQPHNLLLRLAVLGYRHLYWYRGGWEAWDAHELPKAPLTLDVR